MTGDEGSAPTRHATAEMRRLRWLGFALPLAGLLALEAFRFVFVEDVALQHAEHVALAAIGAIGILAFAALMFRLIDRAEALVIRQNRELTAVNAVSTAVQGELAVEQIIDAALDVVAERTGATEASVVVFGREPGRQGALERRIIRGNHPSAPVVGEQTPHLVEIPLARGASVMGRMRLHLPADGLEPDLLATATLNNIGHQLACSIEIGQLVDDLQRRETEDRGLYDVLLRISSQKPLVETLAELCGHARELLNADAVEMHLSPGATLLLESAGGETASLENVTHTDAGGLTIAAANRPGAVARLRLPLANPEMSLGEMRVAPGGGSQVNEREWGLLQRTAELAVIAISNSRMRERERQVAVLAERERIAREMHDSLAQVLGFIHLRLVDLRAKVARVESPQMNANLDELSGIAQDAYRDVREAILGLRESSRAGRSLFENLRAYVERYQHQAGIDTRFETDFDEQPGLSPQAEIHVIRVIQEALTNVRKHARARHAVVRAEREPGGVAFVVEDDGRGFDVARSAPEHDGGFGLHAMRERMELVGGTLEIVSAPGEGTRVIARVPVVAASANGTLPKNRELVGGGAR